MAPITESTAARWRHDKPRRELTFVVWMAAANLVLSALLFIVKARSDAIWPSITTRSATEGIVLGGFFSQVVALSVWTALFPGSNRLRLLWAPLTLVFGVCMLTALAVPMSLDGVYLRQTRASASVTRWLVNSLLSGTVFLSVFCLVQMPFWMLRYTIQLRIIHESQSELSSPTARQFSLRYIFGMASYLTIPLAMTRAVVPGVSMHSFWIAILAVTFAGCAFGVLYLWAIMGTKRIWWGLIALLLLSEVLVAVGSRVYMQAEPRVGPRDWPYIVAAFRGVRIASLLVGVGNGLAARAA